MGVALKLCLCRLQFNMVCVSKLYDCMTCNLSGSLCGIADVLCFVNCLHIIYGILNYAWWYVEHREMHFYDTQSKNKRLFSSLLPMFSSLIDLYAFLLFLSCTELTSTFTLYQTEWETYMHKIFVTIT